MTIMPGSPIGSRVLIRRASPRDRDHMLRITKDTWGGNDYLPFVWNEWLMDWRGMLMVATFGDRVVGLQHAAVHPDGGAWLEGIRVDPELQGQGIGARLLSRGIEWAQQMGRSVVRLSTSDQNEASNRMAERAGLDVVGHFRMVEAAPTHDPIDADVRVGTPGDLDVIAEFLEARDRRFYTEGWSAYRITLERLGVLLAMGCIAVIGSGCPDAVAISTYNGRRPQLRLGLLTGSLDGMITLARWARMQAECSSLESIRGPIDPRDGTLEALGSAGFRTDFEHGMYLRELRIP